jgi:hypothetical protein
MRKDSLKKKIKRPIYRFHDSFQTSSVSFCIIKKVLEFLNNLWGVRDRVGRGVVVLARQASQPGGMGSLEVIPGLLKSLKIWAQLSACLPLSLLTPN